MNRNRNRNLVHVAFLLLLAISSGWSFYLFGLDSVLTLMYEGDLIPYLNEYASGWRARQSSPTLQDFLQEGHAQLFRYGVLVTALTTASFASYALHPRKVEHFFQAKTSPFNLALFRITVFGLLLSFDLEQVHWYADLPSNLQVAPPGLSGLLPYLPTDPTIVSVLTLIFQGACIFGLLGLFTRTSAAIALLSGLYVLGIPQLYGKVGHYHHLLWFTALLIPSRSADTLSLDAIWASLSPTAPLVPEPDRCYTPPIRWAWLLIGIIYFFPGFWKFVTEGFGWALTQNLKHEMHAKWFLRSIIPPFRIDHYPLLYKGAGLFTLVFELGFLFTLPFRSLRPVGTGAALSFHQSTWLFMGVAFLSLQPVLLFLLDVRHGLTRLAHYFSVPSLTLSYDPNEPWQERVAKTLIRMDVFGRLDLQAAPMSPPEDESPLLAVSSSNGPALWTTGTVQMSAFLRLVQCVPLAVFLLPLAPLARRPADNRSVSTFSSGSRAIMIVGSVLLAANVFCGLGQINSYPFSVYPTFAGLTDTTRTTLRVEGTTASGRVIDVLDGAQNNEQVAFAADRFRGLLNSILRTDDPASQRAKLRSLWTVLRTQRREFQSITSLRFYRSTYSTNPDRSFPLLSTSLIAQLDAVNASGASSSSN